MNKNHLQRPVFWLYIFAAMFVLSTLLYDWHSFFAFKYYRRDGNFIIAYAPLFVLPLFSFKFNLQKIVRTFYVFVLTLYAALFIYHIATIHQITPIAEILFNGLFYAQNAVGGFLAVIAGLGFAYYYHRRGLKELCFFLAIFIMLIATYSRGSILGFLLALVAWYCSVTKRFKTLAGIVAIPIILTIAALSIGYPYYLNEIRTHNQITPHYENVGAKTANIFGRVFDLWPQAYYMFLHSPMVGTGVGSYDDRPIRLKKIIPLVSYNAQHHKVHTDRHAHHSYLMILAEQGMLGLGVFLIFWVSLFLYLMQIRGAPVLKDFLLIAYFTLTFAAFTEHRITTPSNMLPFTIIAGLFMVCERSVQTYAIKKMKPG